MAKKKRLGKGLDALLGPDKTAASKTASTGKAGGAGNLRELPLEQLQPGKYQPRTQFAEQPLEELAESIKANGVMQPILVRPIPSRGAKSGVKWEIIAGERRWRASQMAGLTEIPAIIRQTNDDKTLALSLIENIQREDLNPMEEALALTRLVEEFKFTHQQLADAVGRPRASITNTLRLVRLAPPVAELLEQGQIEIGHAKVLLALVPELQTSLAKRVVHAGLNVRQTEALVRQQQTKPKQKAGKSPGKDPDTRRLESNLADTLGQPVQIRHSKAGKGQLIISYNSSAELDGVLEKLGYQGD